MKSVASAGATGVAATVTTVCAPDGRSRVAVTVLTCWSPDSPVSSDSRIAAGVASSLTTGSGSSLPMVPWALAASAARFTFSTLDSVTVKVSSASSASSSTVSTVKFMAVSPAAKVSVPAPAVKSSCSALSPLATEVAQPTCSSRPLCAASDTVNAIASPSFARAAATLASGGSSSSMIVIVASRASGSTVAWVASPSTAVRVSSVFVQTDQGLIQRTPSSFRTSQSGRNDYSLPARSSHDRVVGRLVAVSPGAIR